MRTNRPAARSRRRWRLWGILILVAVGIGAGTGWYFWLGPGKPAAITAAESTQNYTTTVRRGDLILSANGSGTLAAGQSAALNFSAAGLVTELNVQVGDPVQAGDVLARVAQSSKLEASLADAELQRLQAQQSLAALQSNADLTLAQSYQAVLKAQSAFASAEAANTRAAAYSRCSQAVATRYQAALDRAAQKLSDLSAADQSSDAWINARSAYDTALANSTVCVYTEDEKISAAATLEVARAALQQAEDAYNTLKSAAGIDPSALALAEAKAEAADAQVAAAQEALAGLTLTAPFAGKVMTVAGSVGSMAGTQTFITLADTSQPVLAVSLDENDLDKFILDAAASVVFDALPDTTFTGTVIQVDPQLTTSGQYKIIKGVVALDETSAARVQDLPLGLNATITIISQEAKAALLLPEMALKELGDQEYAVMLVGSDGKLKLQVVEVGLQDGTSAQILSGLAEGDVVSTGTVQAQSGANNTSGAIGLDERPANPQDMLLFPGGPLPDGGGVPPP